MKKRIWIGLAAVTLVLTAAVAIRAETRGWRHWQGHAGPWGPAWYITHQLNLSDAQKKQIGVLWQAERPRVAAIVRDLAAANTDLQKADAENNDTAARQIVARQGTLVTQLLLEKEKLRAGIYNTVLSSQQKTKADEFQHKFNRQLDALADRLQQAGMHAN